MQDNIDDEESIQTIGEILRNARIKQGKTLHNIANILCIRSTYLDAIENMDLKNIPEPPYGIGFIRSYAEFLGLNSDRIVSSYKQTLHGLTEKNNQITENKINSSKPKMRHIMLGLLALICLICIWSAWPLYQENTTIEAFEHSVEKNDNIQPLLIEKTEISAPTTTTATNPTDNQEITKIITPANETAVNTQSSQSVEEDTSTLSVKETPEVSKVKMVLVGPSWVELKVNGQTILSRTLQKGYEYVLTDAEHTTVTAGRHYNVKFFVNGNEVKILTATRRKNVALNKFIKPKN